MGSNNFKAIDQWIEEKAIELPMPENELYQEFIEFSNKTLGKQEVERCIDDLNQRYWKMLLAANIWSLAEIPNRTLIDIKQIANCEQVSLEYLFEIIDDFYKAAKHDINDILSKSSDSTCKNKKPLSEWKKTLKEHMIEFIYDILLTSNNASIKFLLEKIVDKKEKMINKYQNFLNRDPALSSRNIDVMQQHFEEFEAIFAENFPFHSKVLTKYLMQFIKVSFVEILKVFLEKECKAYSKSIAASINIYNYCTNNEIKILTEQWIQDFENLIANKCGLIPTDLKNNIKKRLLCDIRKRWRETIINTNLNDELFNFTKKIIVKLSIGWYKLFDPKFCKQMVLIKKLLMKSIPNSVDHGVCLELISELSIYFDNQDYYHPEESEYDLCQNFLKNSNKKERYFFLICVVLVTSMQHYSVCPELQILPPRNADERHFSWLLNIINTAFQLNLCIPNLRRFDDPMLLCDVIMRATKEELKNMGVAVNNSHEEFSQKLKEHIKSSYLRKERLWLMKKTPSEEITITVSGYTSQNYEDLEGLIEHFISCFRSEDKESDDWAHLINLPKQGTTYNYSWSAGNIPKVINKAKETPLGRVAVNWLLKRFRKVLKGIGLGFLIPKFIKRMAPKRWYLELIDFWEIYGKLSKLNWKFFKEHYILTFLSPVDCLYGELFRPYKRESESWGIKLATVIMSGKFGNSKINLIGFSLGCNVIYHCLKRLSENRMQSLINNVILFGGASSVDNDWQSCRSVVSDRFINVRSNNDWILFFLYQMSELEEPIGLKIIDVNGIENYETSIGHRNYRDNLGELFNLIKYEGR